MGLNAYLMVVAPYLGGVTGGSIQFNPHLGWRWAMYIAAIMYAALLIAIFLFGESPHAVKESSRDSGLTTTSARDYLGPQDREQ